MSIQRRPDYITFPGYWAANAELLWSPKWGKSPAQSEQGSWVSVLRGDDTYAPFPAGVVDSWANTFGGHDALDMFVHEFFMTRTVDSKATVPVPVREFTTTDIFGLVIKDFREQAERSCAPYTPQHDYRMSAADGNLLYLFELCFTGSIDGLSKWLRVDDGVDYFRVAELLQDGSPASTIPAAIAHGIDASLLNDFVGRQS
jgi:hypothetical protein